MANWARMLRMTAVFVFPAGAGAQEAPRPADVAGSWNGRLEAVSLTVVFHIASTPETGLTATMDSPDQGAKGIPVGVVTFVDSVLRMAVPAIGGEFEGRLGGDGRIQGEWRQGGGRLPLVLERGAAAAPRRPQEPDAPLPYDEEEIDFSNDAAGVRLAGTFTRPRPGGPHPAVVLITGSGPQDRNETLLGHKPFLVLADHLTRQGIAVLRYDDRGIGGSTGEFGTATSRDFADDALAAVAALRKRGDVDASRIGLVGHSEGGLIAPLAARNSEDVAFIVMLAGPGVPGEDILYEQARLISRASGAPERLIELNTRAQQRLFEVVKTTADTAESRPRVRAVLAAMLDSLSTEERGAMMVGNDPSAFVEAQAAQVTSPWFRWFLRHNPAEDLRHVTVPVLALYGELDLQVPPGQNAPVVTGALVDAGNQDVTVEVLPRLNHLFQTATTGAPSEYGTIEETFSPVALEYIASWILERFGNR